MEIWRDITGYEGLYQVSNEGRVKSLSRLTKKSGKGSRILPEKYLIPDIGEYGKQRVRLRLNGKVKRFHISHLVARAFPDICGPWFPGAQVHHDDENPGNNKADNLKVVSVEEHLRIHRDRGQRKGSKNSFFGRHHSAETKKKLSVSNSKPIMQVSLDGIELCYWYSCTACERETGMNKAAINRCCLGKKDTAFGFRWKYV